MSVTIEDGWLVQRDASGGEEIAVEACGVCGLSKMPDKHGRKRSHAEILGSEGGFLFDADVGTLRALLVQERRRRVREARGVETEGEGDA